MAVKLQTDYEVDTGDVTLTIIIGDGQIGTSLVRLDGKELAIGDVTELKLGKGSSLAGKELFIKTVVADVNDKTNNTSVSYQLKGGVSDREFHLDGSVNEEGGSVIYRAAFELKK